MDGKKNRLIVISLDAMICEDVKELGKMPAFQWLLRSGATVEHKHTVFGHKHTIPEHRMLMPVREQLFCGAKGRERASCAYDAFPEKP